MKKFNPNATLTKYSSMVLPIEFHEMARNLDNGRGILTMADKLKPQVKAIIKKYPLEGNIGRRVEDKKAKRFYLSWVYKLIHMVDTYIMANESYRKRLLREIESNCDMVGKLTWNSLDLAYILQIIEDNYPELHKRFLETSTYTDKEMVLDSLFGSCSLVGSHNLVHPVSRNYGSLILNGVEGKLTSPNGVTPDSKNYILKTFGNRFKVTLKQDTVTKDYTKAGGFIYSVTSLDAPIDFTETKKQRTKDFLTYLDTLAPMNLEAMISEITDDEVTSFICDNETYVSNIYAPYEFSENTYARTLSDDCKRLEDTDRLVPHSSGLSPDVVDTIFNSDKEDWVETTFYSSVGKWSLNIAEMITYPRLSYTLWVSNPNNEVYINNLYLLKKAIVFANVKKSIMEDVKDFHLTSDGYSKILKRLLHKTSYEISKTENEDPFIYVYNPQEHVDTDTPEELCLHRHYYTVVHIGETVLLEHSDTGTITKHPINSVEDIDKLKEFGIVRKD